MVPSVTVLAACMSRVCVKRSCPLLSRGKRMDCPHKMASLYVVIGVNSTRHSRVSGHISCISRHSFAINRIVDATALGESGISSKHALWKPSHAGYTLECARSAP